MRRSHLGLAVSALLIPGLAAPLAAFGAVDFATYSVVDFQRTDTVVAKGTDSAGVSRDIHHRTTMRFAGKKGANRVTIDFRNRVRYDQFLPGNTLAMKLRSATQVADWRLTSGGENLRCAFAGGIGSGALLDISNFIKVHGPAFQVKGQVQFQVNTFNALDQIQVAQFSRKAAEPACGDSRFSLFPVGLTGPRPANAVIPNWSTFEVAPGTLRRKLVGAPQKVVLRSTKRSPLTTAPAATERIGTVTVSTRTTLWLMGNAAPRR